MEPTLLFMLLFGGLLQNGPGGRGKADVRALFPALLPGPPALRLVIAAQLAAKADSEISQANKEVIQEIVDKDKIPNEDALKTRFAKLHGLFEKLPTAVKSDIRFAQEPKAGPQK